MQGERPPLVLAADCAKTLPAVRAAYLELVQLVRDLSVEVQELRARVKCQSDLVQLLQAAIQRSA
jgi:hypothetical protein